MLCHHEALPTTLYKRLIYVVYVETACGLKHAGMTRMAQGVEHQLSLEASQICITSLPAVGLHHVTSCYIMLHVTSC